MPDDNEAEVGTQSGPQRTFVDDAFRLSPEPGGGRRWFDLPYKFLDWLVTGYRRKIIPRFVRVRITHLLNVLHQVHQHQLDQVWSREDDYARLTEQEAGRFLIAVEGDRLVFDANEADALRSNAAALLFRSRIRAEQKAEFPPQSLYAPPSATLQLRGSGRTRGSD